MSDPNPNIAVLPDWVQEKLKVQQATIERLEAEIADLQSALMSIMQHANQAMTSSVDSKEQA